MIINEYDPLPASARKLFERSYRCSAPEDPHHVVATLGGGSAGARALCYVHFTALGEVLLGGGACVDAHRLRSAAPAERAALRAMGGPYRATLEWALSHFAARFPAIFGYCGDRLAERIDLAAGFVKTEHPHLLVHWTRALPAAEQARLIAIAHGVGPF